MHWIDYIEGDNSWKPTRVSLTDSIQDPVVYINELGPTVVVITECSCCIEQLRELFARKITGEWKIGYQLPHLDTYKHVIAFRLDVGMPNPQKRSRYPVYDPNRFLVAYKANRPFLCIVKWKNLSKYHTFQPFLMAKTISIREKEVLKLIADGFSSRQIADQLFISKHTAISHRKNLIEKFRVKNTAQLIKKASKVMDL